jgi:hypothetical protein
MRDAKEAAPSRDDAQAQPESGYPDGRLPMKPSADPDASAVELEAQSGSEAEFNSASVKKANSREA